MILIKSGIGAKDDIGNYLAGLDVQGIESIDVDRCTDGTYEISVKSRYDHDTDDKFLAKGFIVITGMCKDCLYYGGQYIHDFVRGNLGDCFKQGKQYPQWHQCKLYVDKKAYYEEMRAEEEREKQKKIDAETIEGTLKAGIPLKHIDDPATSDQ